MFLNPIPTEQRFCEVVADFVAFKREVWTIFSVLSTSFSQWILWAPRFLFDLSPAFQRRLQHNRCLSLPLARSTAIRLLLHSIHLSLLPLRYKTDSLHWRSHIDENTAWLTSCYLSRQTRSPCTGFQVVNIVYIVYVIYIFYIVHILITNRSSRQTRSPCKGFQVMNIVYIVYIVYITYTFI